MIFQSQSLKKFALLFSATLVGIGLLGTLIFIFYSAARGQKSFGNLSVPASIADPGPAASSQNASSSSTPMPEFNLPDFLKTPKKGIKNNNIQLKPNPSQEDIDAYIEEVKRVAVYATSVAIDGCEPDPVVVRTGEGSAILFENGDDATHLITVEDKKFAVETDSIREIPMSFASGTGIYNYDCDSHFSVGTFWIE